MKHFLIYFGLFLGFAAAFSSTKALEKHSRLYADCAQKWEHSIKLAKDQPGLAVRLLELEAKAEMTLNGKACPELRRDHAQKIRAQLEGFKRS